MSRRFIVPVLALILLLSTHLPAAAAVDAPSRCGQIGSATPVGQWVSGTIDSATDVDWYRFALPEHANVQLLLGGLPANYRMDVYRHCGDTDGFHFHSYQPGTQFEELILSTSFAPYVPAYVRISGCVGRVQRRSRTSCGPKSYRPRLSVLSSRTFVEPDGRHIVGEVLTTGRHRNVRVTATLFDSAESVIATKTVPAMVRHIDSSRGDRRRTPFEVVFDTSPGLRPLPADGSGRGNWDPSDRRTELHAVRSIRRRGWRSLSRRGPKQQQLRHRLTRRVRHAVRHARPRHQCGLCGDGQGTCRPRREVTVRRHLQRSVRIVEPMAGASGRHPHPLARHRRAALEERDHPHVHGPAGGSTSCGAHAVDLTDEVPAIVRPNATPGRAALSAARAPRLRAAHHRVGHLAPG